MQGQLISICLAGSSLYFTSFPSPLILPIKLLKTLANKKKKKEEVEIELLCLPSILQNLLNGEGLN